MRQKATKQAADAPDPDDGPVESPASIRVQMLGGFAVTVGNRVVPSSDWRTQKARSLVKLLCLAPDHRLHREQVIDLLWPGLEPEAAARNMRSTLHVARRALEPDRSATTRSYLHADRNVLVLGIASDLWIDAEAFDAAAAAARRSHDPVAYQSALELYTGELLPEDRYEDWAAAPREALKETYLGLLVGLAQLHEARTEYAAATTVLERAVAVDLTHEDAHVGLMRLHALSGRQGQALRQYVRLWDGLARELDVEPSATAQHLHKDIAAGRFPPPRSLSQSPEDTGLPAPPDRSSPQHNLPAPLTSFIGRQHDIATIKRLLPTTRLMTLTGTGGSGKSRLALQLASQLVEEYRHGVWFVELSSLADPTLVVGAVASATGAREQPGQGLTQTLIDALHSKSILLVLDNCEHLIDACAELAATLLTECPLVHIIATSREALRVPGETTWRVPSMSLTLPSSRDPQAWEPSNDPLTENEAMALFVDRVRLARPDFVLTSGNVDAVALICHRLDGLPLAIELAAARVSLLNPQQLAARLDDALCLLSSGSRTVPSRQKTLQATLDWSFALLDVGERILFRRLAVFAGGWTLEAAEAVCAGPHALGIDGSVNGEIIGKTQVLTLLARLVDKSLVQVEEDLGGTSGASGVRYRLLETVRQYAAQHLRASGEAEAVSDQHAAYFLCVAEDAEPAYTGPDQAAWLDRLEREHDNLRAALRWSVEHGDATQEARLCAALWRFWYIHGHVIEAERWMADALARGVDDSIPLLVRARMLQGAGTLAWTRGDLERANGLFSRALTLFQEAGDQPHIASTCHYLGMVAELRSKYHDARRWYQEALRRRETLGDTPGTAHTLQNLGNLAREEHNLGQAVQLYERSLALQREIGNKRGIALALASLAVVALDEGDYASSASLSRQSLELYEELGVKSQSVTTLQNLGYAILFEGNHEQALSFMVQCLRLAIDVGDKRGIACGLEGVASAIALFNTSARGAEQSARLFGAAEALRETLNMPLPPADQALNERSMTTARDTLGETAYDDAWLAGRSLLLDEAVTEALATGTTSSIGKYVPVTPPAPSILSRREREVAVLVAGGWTNRQIAAELGLANRTVDTHVGNILRKLGLASRFAVHGWATAHELVPRDPSSAS